MPIGEVAANAGTGISTRNGAPSEPSGSDPDLVDLIKEYLAPGRVLLDLPLSAGDGSVQVTSHTASETQPPSEDDVLQEWRVLRFRPATGPTKLIQSVTKVWIAPLGRPEPRVQLQWAVLAHPYTRSLVAVTLATLVVLRAPVLPVAPGSKQETLRILCIGLGGGSVPSFFSESLAHADIDVVELEPTVVQAAFQAMGFQMTSRLRVIVEDGATFAAQAAEDVAAGRAAAYDAVVVDAMDARGGIPVELHGPHGGLARALKDGLLHKRGSLVATNFMPLTDMTPPLATYRAALAKHTAGLSFSIEAEGPGNLIAVQTCGGANKSISGQVNFRQRLLCAASEVAAATNCPFDMAALVARSLRFW